MPPELSHLWASAKWINIYPVANSIQSRTGISWTILRIPLHSFKSTLRISTAIQSWRYSIRSTLCHLPQLTRFNILYSYFVTVLAHYHPLPSLRTAWAVAISVIVIIPNFTAAIKVRLLMTFLPLEWTSKSHFSAEVCNLLLTHIRAFYRWYWPGATKFEPKAGTETQYQATGTSPSHQFQPTMVCQTSRFRQSVASHPSPTLTRAVWELPLKTY